VADDVAVARAALEQAVSVTSTAGNGLTATATPAHPRRRPRKSSGVTPAATPTSARLTALTALYRQQFGAEPQYPSDTVADPQRTRWLEQQLLPRFEPKRAQRDALARARADAVQAAVLSNSALSPMRVFLTQSESGGGPAGSVRMQLQLE
jgi:hypothetical protein